MLEEVAAKTGALQRPAEIAAAADVQRAQIGVERELGRVGRRTRVPRDSRAFMRHRRDVPFELDPAVEPQLARNRELRFRELRRALSEFRERTGIAGTRGTQQLLGALLLLLEVQTKVRITGEAIGHAEFPSSSACIRPGRQGK